LTWTAIHPIDEKSPLLGATAASLAASDAEIVVSVVGLDGTTSATVHALHSYRWDDLRWNERFVDILLALSGDRPAVDYGRFHDTQPVGAEHRLETDRQSHR